MKIIVFRNKTTNKILMIYLPQSYLVLSKGKDFDILLSGISEVFCEMFVEEFAEFCS